MIDGRQFSAVATPLPQREAQRLIREFMDKEAGNHDFRQVQAGRADEPIRKAPSGAWFASCVKCKRDVIALPGAEKLSDLAGSATERGCGS